MRIIRGHDYYDRGLQFGIDKSIVFVRNEATMEPFNANSSPKSLTELVGSLVINQRIATSRNTTLMPVFVVVGDMIWRGYCHQDYKRKYVWDKDSIEKYRVKSTPMQILGRQYIGDPKSQMRFLADYFTPKNLTKRQIELMVDNRITILTSTLPNWGFHRNVCINVNPYNLKDLEFYRVLDPFQAYQRIEQWVSGVLPSSGVDMVEVSDNVRIEKKGFDRHSFRSSIRPD